MAAVAILPTPREAAPAASLYAIEDTLEALLDSAELVEAGQQEQYLAEVGLAMTAAAAKRDRVAQFLVHLDSQIDLADAEIKRLKERKSRFTAVSDRLREYVVGVIQALGNDDNGKPRKLEGKTSTLSIRRCPASIEIADEALVPFAYVSLKSEIPVETWIRILDELEPEHRAEIEHEHLANAESIVRKRDVKAAIAAGVAVCGARLVDDKFSLVVK